MIINSKINKNIKYIENTNLEIGDSKGLSQLYEYDILGIPTIISIGKRNDEYLGSGVIYFPVYLIVNNKFRSKIGIIETTENCENNIYDEDGDIDLDNCSEPIFFNFVSQDYVSKLYYKEEHNDTEEISIEEYNSEGDYDNWINIYLSSDEYNIFDNDGDGNCLFIALKDGYDGINIDMSVLELRTLLVNNATDNVYKNYKDLYNSFKKSILVNNDEMVNIKKKNTELKEKLQTIKTRKERIAILRDGELLIEKFESLKNENDLSNTLISEYEFMSSIKTIDDFKEALLKKTFWADTWAISTLEKALNVKLIILSSENFENGDIDNILLCSQRIDNISNKNPEYYIILDYSGNHYKLITHNELTIFTFEYLPKEIKELICSKCLEKMGGSYNNIPDFMELTKNANLRVEPELSDIYDVEENTVFMIHSKSAGNHAPGKGTGEYINTSNILNYSELSNIKNWRRILSTHYESPFLLDGLKWNTVEHYIQGVKFKKTNPDYYKSFSLISESKYNKDPMLAKREVTSKVKLCDEDYDYDGSLYEAYKQLFLEDNYFRRVLQLTKEAKVVHYLYRKPPKIMRELMIIRNNNRNT